MCDNWDITSQVSLRPWSYKELLPYLSLRAPIYRDEAISFLRLDTGLGCSVQDSLLD